MKDSTAPRPERFIRRIVEKSRNYRLSGSIVIVAFGDSVTMGWTAEGKLEPEAVYHHRLKRMLEARYPLATFSVINSGIGGDTAGDGLRRLDRDVLQYRPDLVLVAFGLNDASDDPAQLLAFRARLQEIASRVREMSDIILLTPSFMASRDSDAVPAVHREMLPRLMKLQNEGYLALFAEAVREVGRAERLPVADVYAAWAALASAGADTTAMLANGLNHPTGEAHDIAARQIMELIDASEGRGA